jgi:hypothetical protein
MASDMASELIDRAKEGDAAAIAALLTRALKPQGIAVRGDRHSYCLQLWLRGPTLPPQGATVAYVQQFVQRLGLEDIGILQLHGEQGDGPEQSWYSEISLLGDGKVAPDKAAPLPLDQLTAPVLLGDGKVAPDKAAPLSPDQPTVPALNALTSRLHQAGLAAQVTLQGHELQVRWPAVRVANPKQAMAQVYQLLTTRYLTDPDLEAIETLVVMGLSRSGQVSWQYRRSLPRRSTAVDDTDLMSFQNRYSNVFIFPALMVLGMVMNSLPTLDRLLWGIKIWIHEFGHATVAWLSGRRAIPLPVGWTNVDPQRSLLVYLLVLTLLGLLFWAGRREQKRWPMGLALALALVQFWCTWVLSPQTFDMLLAFGGIGGELYLSTLLMVGFYFPMPNYWRWDFYRFPVVLGAAFTFWGQFGLWQQIRRGRASIPFGGLWGDPDHGDMNILINHHGWTPGDIIGTYSMVAHLCLLALVGVYGYVLYRRHRHDWAGLRQRWIRP